MEETKLIAMRKNLGLGHKGDILLTTQERVDTNQEPIAKDIIDEEHAQELVRRWNAFEKDGLVDELRGCLVELVDIIDGGTVMDTFTTQPAKAAIAKVT